MTLVLMTSVIPRSFEVFLKLGNPRFVDWKWSYSVFKKMFHDIYMEVFSL